MNFQRLFYQILILLACLGLTETSLALQSSECQVFGVLLVTKNEWQENTSNSSIIDIKLLPKVINNVIQELNLNHSRYESISSEYLIKNIKIEPVAGTTDVFKISYAHPDLKFSKKIVYSVMKNYVKENSLQVKHQASTLIKLIEKDIAKKESGITIAEKILIKLCESKNTSREEIYNYKNNLKKLNTEYEALLMKLQRLRVAENQSVGNARIVALSNKDCSR